MLNDALPAGSSDGADSTNEAASMIASSLTKEIENAKRLTEAYKEREYKARERDGELLAELHSHYCVDNDTTGADGTIRTNQTKEGNFQTSVTRSRDETAKFLSHKRQFSQPNSNIRGQSDDEKPREQMDRQVALAPLGDPPEWLLKAMGLDAREETIPAMDVIFDNVDSLLSAGKFEEVNHIIEHVPLEGPSLSFLMGILTITLPAADRLPNRAKFFERLYRLCKAMGRDADDLLGGLKQWSGADGSGLFGR